MTEPDFTEAEYAEYAQRLKELLAQLRPLLADKPPDLIGVAIAELSAAYIAGFSPDVREDVLTLQIDTIRELIPIHLVRIALEYDLKNWSTH